MSGLSRRELVVRGGRWVAATVAAGGLRVGSASGGGDRLGELARSLDGEVVHPGDAAYAAGRLLWNARFDTVSKPMAIAYPASVRDVQRALRWVAAQDVPFALRSGGHSYAGWSTTRGLVLDLSRLSAVRPLADGTVRVGAGARLGDVLARLDSAGRGVAVGTCPTVGISGLALGGGHGFSSRAHGLACDNVVAAEIVTADGRIRRCDARREPGLFWALRGAGQGNFGVVTRVVLRTFEVGDVTTVNVQWQWETVREVVRAWQTHVPSAADSLSCVLALRPGQGGEPPRVAINGQVFGTKEEATALIGPLVAIGSPTRVSVVSRPFSGAVSYFAGEEPDERRAYAAKSNYATRPLTDAGIDVLVAAIERVTGDERFASAEVLAFAHGGAINRVGAAETAFVHRDAVFSLRYAAFWPADAPAETGPAVLGWIRDVHAAIAPHVSHAAVVNYPDPGLAGWARAYYGANLRRLVAVKREYDPDNLFRYPQSIPTRP
jgi:FAD/FMN-containing dehydrogenase